MKYTVNSLAEIVAQLRANSDTLVKLANEFGPTDRERNKMLGEAFGWRSAASLLENAEIVA